jgi:hypothetical protein
MKNRLRLWMIASLCGATLTLVLGTLWLLSAKWDLGTTPLDLRTPTWHIGVFDGALQAHQGRLLGTKPDPVGPLGIVWFPIREPTFGGFLFAANPMSFVVPFWAIFSLDLVVTLLLALRLRALRSRLKFGCIGCGYDLRGVPVGAPCPECGRDASQ